ncbi:MAG: hypothetical protein NVS3B16_09480 [Vulcanimicrobiaceae bacterium]
MVHRPIRQFAPPLESYANALRAYREADYDRSLALLSRHDSIEASLLRARCFLRLEHAEAALRALAEHDMPSAGDAAGAEAGALTAIAYMSSGNAAVVEELLVDGRVRAMCSGSAALEAEAEYTAAIFLFSQQRLDEACEALDRVLEICAESPYWLRDPARECAVTLDEQRARALDLRGRIAGLDQRYDVQARYIIAALAELDRSKTFDHYIEAHLLLNLAVLVRDFDLPEAYALIQKRSSAMRFSGFTKRFEFEIRRSLGLCHEAHGDHVGALREFRKAAAAAPTDALRIAVVLDRAALASELSENTCADEEIEFARDLSERIDWADIRGDESLSLLRFAEVLAGRDPPEARRMLDLFLDKKRSHSIMLGFRADLRYTAYENRVVSVVQRAEGQASRAVLSALRAYDAYQRAGCIRHAATIAADLYEMTGEAAYRVSAAEYVKAQPSSHLARRVAKFK